MDTVFLKGSRINVLAVSMVFTHIPAFFWTLFFILYAIGVINRVQLANARSDGLIAGSSYYSKAITMLG